MFREGWAFFLGSGGKMEKIYFYQSKITTNLAYKKSF